MQCKWAGCAVCRAAMEAHKGSKGRCVFGLEFAGWAAHAVVQAHGWGQVGSKLEAGWRHGFCWYERAGEPHERTQAVGLRESWAGLHSTEREGKLTAAGR